MKRKFMFAVLVIAVVFSLSVSACSDAQIPTGLSTVTALDLSALVTAPVSGQPLFLNGNTITHAQYTGTIEWTYNNGRSATGEFFLPNTIYVALVTLTAAEGFTFDGIAADSFFHTNVRVVNAAGDGTVRIIFPSTGTTAVTVSDFNLSALVTPPTTDASPQITLASAQYTGTITWLNYDGTPFTGVSFYADRVFQARVSLVARAGYTFNGVPANSFVHEGMSSIVNNQANHWVVTIVFPATEIRQVNALNLGFIVNPPARGVPVQNSVIHSQFTGTIDWFYNSSQQFLGTHFAPETVYTAIVTLTAVDGFCLNAVPVNGFTHPGATSISNAQGSGVVTIIFPETLDAFTDAVVTMTDLTALLPAPVADIVRSSAIIPHFQISGSVQWELENGAVPTGSTFTGGAAYRAIVTLDAEYGYTLTGVAANSFTHAGATSISNAANDGVVTITFTRTGPQVLAHRNLTELITAPVFKQTPVTTLSSSYLSGTIQWMDMEGDAVERFSLYAAYRAVVTLTILDPDLFTFNGILANSFVYTGATVTNAANSGVVNITFPRTIPNYLALAGTAIRGCCWQGNTDTPAALFLNNNTRWAFAWNANPANNHSSWRSILYPDTVDFVLDGNEGGRGHPLALGRFGLEPAHFFSIDLGETRDIVSVSKRTHTGGNRFGAGEIFVSDYPIEVDPNDGNANLVAVFDFDPDSLGLVLNNMWLEIDITKQNDGNPVRGRYLQIRFTHLSPRADGWLSGEFNRLQIGIMP